MKLGGRVGLDRKRGLRMKVKNKPTLSNKEIQNMSIDQIFAHTMRYKPSEFFNGEKLSSFDGISTEDIRAFIKQKEIEYTKAKINNMPVAKIQAEIKNAKVIIAERMAFLTIR